MKAFPKLDVYIKNGLKDKDWYQRTEDLFVQLFGRDQLPLVADLFAATSMNSSLKSNIRLFRRAYYEIQNGLPSVHYLPGIAKQIEQIKSGKGLTGQKIRAFSAAIQGDVNAVVVDIWLLRAFDLDRKYIRYTGPHQGKARSGGATAGQFEFVEFFVREKAIAMGLQPRELSAIIWSGIRNTLTRERDTTYHDILKFQLYNMYENQIINI